jgi:hypothetical protein
LKSFCYIIKLIHRPFFLGVRCFFLNSTENTFSAFIFYILTSITSIIPLYRSLLHILHGPRLGHSPYNFRITDMFDCLLLVFPYYHHHHYHHQYGQQTCARTLVWIGPERCVGSWTAWTPTDVPGSLGKTLIAAPQVYRAIRSTRLTLVTANVIILSLSDR